MRFTAAVLISAFSLAAPVQADDQDFMAPMRLVCAEDVNLHRHLTEDLGLTLTGRGLVTDKHVVAIYRDHDGHFTLTVSAASGEGCVAMKGRAWEDHLPPGHYFAESGPLRR